jgi:pyruvate/2-oxoglutarate dehydrogenase complex dihydrolipoamide dehydrogenase (E3) component
VHEGFDTILAATGRGPNVAPLALDKAGIAIDKGGQIIADGQSRRIEFILDA